MKLRAIIRENIEQAVGEMSIINVPGFDFVNKKTDSNGNIIWKYSNKEDDYFINLIIVKTTKKNWVYKIFAYWKVYTKNYTNGKGKDFEMQFGPFSDLESLEKSISNSLKNNTLIASENYKDNNKIQLDAEIFRHIDKLKKQYDALNNSDNDYFKDLKKISKNLIGDEKEVREFIDKNYPDESDKQLLILIIQKIDQLHNLNKIESIKSLF